VQTIAHRSLAGGQTTDEAKKAFESRLQALARANRQLTQSNWRGVALREIVRLEMEPFGGRTTMDGVDVILDPRQAQNFSLALHELATNASKYGALSNGSGNVGISWTLTANGETNILKFCWQERGGPAVSEPVSVWLRHGAPQSDISRHQFALCAGGFDLRDGIVARRQSKR
jgi:two-component sensor histidine kinase